MMLTVMAVANVLKSERIVKLTPHQQRRHDLVSQKIVNECEENKLWHNGEKYKRKQNYQTLKNKVGRETNCLQ